MFKVADIYGLAYNCPSLKRLGNCPLKVVDHLSFKEKVKYIEGIRKEEIKTILEHHMTCTENR